MHVFVKTLTGKTITIDVDTSETIATLKERIFAVEGIPCDRQNLLLDGKELVDNEQSIGDLPAIYRSCPWSFILRVRA